MEKILQIFKKNKIVFLTSLLSFLFGFSSGYYVLYSLKGENEEIFESPNVIVEKESVQKKCDIQVEISGAVKNPNVYCLDTDSILLDGIEKAGGFAKEYAQKYVSSEVNLAQKLVDSQKVYIPFNSEIKCVKYQYVLSPVSSSSVLGSSKKCISINTGSMEELTELSGVGQSLAQRIIDGRPYKNLEDLDNISGIGEQLLAKIKPNVCL